VSGLISAGREQRAPDPAPAGAEPAAGALSGRRDCWAVSYQVRVLFDTDDAHSRYDHVGTTATCEDCGERLDLRSAPECLVEHARSHEVPEANRARTGSAPKQGRAREVAAPVRNGTVTAGCGVCGAVLPPGRARRWCSGSCRQAAFRRRTAALKPVLPAKADTVYECPECEARYLEQRCPDCNRWCRRLGAGGSCPHCDDLVVVGDLLSPDQLASESPPSPTSSTRRSKERP